MVRTHLTILDKKKKDNTFDQFSICFAINYDPIFGNGKGIFDSTVFLNSG
jgi:hypothetical protein